MTQYPDWFACYADRFFAHHLTPLAGRPGLRFLQIGAFTGDASVWLFEHILTGPNATLSDVDTWTGSDEPDHEAMDFADVERVYDERTRDIPGLSKFKEASQSFLQGPWWTAPWFDFIYVDGDHTAVGVLSDAVHAIPLLKVGGLIAFDDYMWKSDKGRLNDPGPAIDVVADLYSDRLERLENPAFPGEGPLQVWFRKI